MDGNVEKYLELIRDGIEKLPFPAEPSELYEPIQYILELKSKRLRPLLVLMASGLFDGDESEALKFALAVELFHNFTLIHDDVMDNAPIRRGVASVHEKWNRDVAILSGDALLIKAYELLAGCRKEVLPKALKLFNQTAIYVCEGQQFDMNFEHRDDVTVPEYLHMISLKTAVLLGASLKLGALSANSGEDSAEALYQFGMNIGVAFQLKDDWLDAYADPAKFGKQTGGDILAGKKTYLVLKALELAGEEQRNRLLRLMSDKKMDGRQKINEVINLFNSLNISQILSNEMHGFFNKGLSYLDALEVPAERKVNLKNLAEQLMNRDS